MSTTDWVHRHAVSRTGLFLRPAPARPRHCDAIRRPLRICRSSSASQFTHMGYERVAAASLRQA
jgi:hypothetical protein